MPVMDSPMTVLALCAVIGYLLGSIPSGMVLARMMGLGDLRKIGSGNIGATNVLRTGNKGAAALTLILDALKGVVAVLIARRLGGADAAQLAALAAFLGHCYPVWLGFRGGKGVATLMGVALGLAWPIGLVFAVVWLGMLAITRISSAGGMSAAISAPIAAFFMGWPHYALALAIMAALVLWRHRANIQRLMAGTEPRIGKKQG